MSENTVEKDAGRCTAFALDTVCMASDPCPVHGCNDTDDGSTAQGCYCDPERPILLPGSEFNQCPHEAVRATCPGCSCPCAGCDRWRAREEATRVIPPGQPHSAR